MTKKEKLIKDIKNGHIDSYLIDTIDKSLLLDIDVLITLTLNGINIEDVIDVCPEIKNYQDTVNKIKIKLIESNNNLSSALPDGYLIYVDTAIMDYYVEKNNLDNICSYNYDNEWFRNFFIPGFRELFKICKNGIPEDFDDICDEILNIKRDGITIQEELNKFNIWVKDFEYENAGLEFMDNYDESDHNFRNK